MVLISGAVISQNSWGYAVGTGRNTSSYINPVHKEAIDYFIKYAGCDNNGEQLDGSPMKEGLYCLHQAMRILLTPG